MIPGEDLSNQYAETLKSVLCVKFSLAPYYYCFIPRNRRPVTFKLALMFPLLPHALRIGSAGFRRFILNIIPSKTLHQVRDMVDILEHNTRSLIKAKKEAVSRGDLDVKDDPKDIISLLRPCPTNFDCADIDIPSQSEAIWRPKKGCL